MSEETINQIKIYLHDCMQQNQSKGAIDLIEEKLQIEKALLDGLFESAQLGIVLTDNEGYVIRVNPEFCRLFGYSSEEVLSRNIDKLLAPENQQDKTRSVTENTALGLKTGFETVRRHKTGRLLPVKVWTAPIHVNGHQVALYGMYQDIGKRKHAEEALQKETAKRETHAVTRAKRSAGTDGAGEKPIFRPLGLGRSNTPRRPIQLLP